MREYKTLTAEEIKKYFSFSYSDLLTLRSLRLCGKRFSGNL